MYYCGLQIEMRLEHVASSCSFELAMPSGLICSKPTQRHVEGMFAAGGLLCLAIPQNVGEAFLQWQGVWGSEECGLAAARPGCQCWPVTHTEHHVHLCLVSILHSSGPRGEYCNLGLL